MVTLLEEKLYIRDFCSCELTISSIDERCAQEDSNIVLKKRSSSEETSYAILLKCQAYFYEAEAFRFALSLWRARVST